MSRILRMRKLFAAQNAVKVDAIRRKEGAGACVTLSEWM
jgi:hypothetical protein